MDKTTTIVILNDTNKPLTVRLPPTAHIIQPNKMAFININNKEIFFKIWEDNTILFAPYKPKLYCEECGTELNPSTDEICDCETCEKECLCELCADKHQEQGHTITIRTPRE